VHRRVFLTWFLVSRQLPPTRARCVTYPWNLTVRFQNNPDERHSLQRTSFPMDEVDTRYPDHTFSLALPGLIPSKSFLILVRSSRPRVVDRRRLLPSCASSTAVAIIEVERGEASCKSRCQLQRTMYHTHRRPSSWWTMKFMRMLLQRQESFWLWQLFGIQVHVLGKTVAG
jgi:hypothetical protein